MAGSPRKHREGAFKPINTLDSTASPVFSAKPSTADMVNEREPPRIFGPQGIGHAADALKDITDVRNEPQFGKASPMRNALKSDRSPDQSSHTSRGSRGGSPSAFIKPKPGTARPQHHRDVQAPAKTTDRPFSTSPSFNPTFSYGSAGPSYPPNNATNHGTNNSPGFAEIPRPANFASSRPVPKGFASWRPVPGAPQNIFSTGQLGNSSVNAWKTQAKPIDLTKQDDDDNFNPDRALGIDKYGSYDPSNFVDSAQASENIKALLEGAFDDEDDKPKTRLRKRKQHDKAAAALTDKLSSLDVNDKAKGESAPAEVEEEEEDDGTVEGLSIKLLPHQIDGVAWMLDKEVGTRKKNGVLPKGGILADDMGLGKTIQALALILTNRRPSADDLAENPKLKVPEAAGKGTLIVAPLALIKQWESEIKTKVDTFPKLKVLVHHGPSRTKRYEDLKKYDIVITTYQTLTSEHGDSSDTLKVGCFGLHWYRIILDEAHSIKNRNAKMTKAAYDLKAVYRWCLTGTPMQNNLDELQSLIRFLKIKPYCEMTSWREQIGQPMKNGRGGLAMKRLQFFLKAFMKRRTKEVLKKDGALNFGKNTTTTGDQKSDGFKIVGRDVQSIIAEFNEAEREFYQSLEARTEKNLAAIMGGSSNDYIGALVLLLRLRQSCNHPDLIKGNLRKEKDSVSTSQQTQLVTTPRKSKGSGGEELDDIADMFGAMSVKVKKCDGCGSKLNDDEVSAGVIRCDECEADMKRLRQQSHSNKANKGKKVRVESTSRPQQARNRLHARKIVESDDEDENGEWLVAKDEQSSRRRSKAGGKHDEDAESGGRWLGDEDSDTDEEDDSTADRGAYASNAEDSEEESVTGSESDLAYSSDKAVDQRHIASTKIRKLLQLLENESDDHKFIVFSEFTSMLDIVEPFLRNAGFRFTRYDGSMKNDDREASLERLRNDQKTRILLCSLRCGSLGLNLTAASRVVIMEPFWNPVSTITDMRNTLLIIVQFVEEQAIDRVHRLNQTRDVVVYKLTIANSVEERILELQQKKRELANAALEGGKAVGKLSMQDILRLFKRDAEHDPSHEDVRSLSLGTGKPAGVLHGTTRGAVTSDGPLQNASTASRQTQLPPYKQPTQIRSPAKKPADAPRKFVIPKSLQPEYEAYKQRDVWNERR